MNIFIGLVGNLVIKMKRKLINYFGLLGVISLISYILAVVLSPLAYPGYDWMSQAVSDLSAQNAPSKMLWNQLSSLYMPCGIVSITLVCIFVQQKLNKITRIGIDLFTLMNWISCVGYTMFPLSKSGQGGNFQDIMHIYVVTTFVILLSLISLIMIIIGGVRLNKSCMLALWALLSLIFMILGAFGTNGVSHEFFGIYERFSVFAVTGFNAVLGVYLFNGFKGE